MSNKSRSQIEKETNLIRRFLENNLERGLGHEDIIKELGISRATYYRYVRRIYKHYEKVWDEIYLPSVKYRTVQLADCFNTCIQFCKEIMDDPNTKPSDRIEAAKTMCEAQANLAKLAMDGPTFRPSLRLSSPYNNHQELDNNSNKELPN
jgi:hypothetical protein